jgi:MFS family permease
MAPPNGGRDAWLVVLGYFLVCVATLGTQYCFGALYVELLGALGGSPGATAFVGSLCSGMQLAPGGLSGMIIARIGARRACVVGGVLASAGTALSALATELWQLYLAFGLLAGVGHSLAFFSPLTLMPLWFSSRLARAHAVANLGAAVTPLAIGPLAPAAFALVGWRLALVGLAVIELVLLLAAATLLSEPHAATSRAAAGGTVPGMSSTIDSAKPAAAAHTPIAAVGPQAGAPQGSCSAAALRLLDAAHLPDPRRKSGEFDLQERTLGMWRVAGSAPAPAAAAPAGAASRPDFAGALRERRVLLLCAGLLLWGAGSWIAVVHLVRLGIERGMGEEQAPRLLLMFLAIGSATLRVPVAAVADRFGRTRVFGCCLLLRAGIDAACAAAPFASSRGFLCAFAFLVGGLTGAMNSVMVSLPVELGIGHAKMRAAASLIISPFGIGLIVGPVVGGVLRSATGDYTGTFLLSAGLLVAAAAFVALQASRFGRGQQSQRRSAASASREHARDRV